MKRKKQSSTRAVYALLVVLIILLIAASGTLIWLCLKLPSMSAPSVGTPPTLENTELTGTFPDETAETETVPPVTTLPEPEHVVSTATIGAMGDLLMHAPVFAASRQSDGSYDFTAVFQYLAEYVSALDYAAVNLETTLASNNNGFAYKGYPNFNCPDEIIDGVKNAGFDMLLTANNHSYDTTLVGYKRTLQVIREKGLQSLGTYESAEDVKWAIQEINGIKIGMLAYTYATGVSSDGRPSLNYNAPIAEANICNYFYSGNLPGFYSEVEGYLAEMKQAGAEATILYIHWGQEYQLTANAEQQAMAQELCNMGIDVIVGGHPHVVEPIVLLESAVDPSHKTVCLYSTGNAISNQRKGLLSSINTAHTEDGILFSVTFEKYSDGTVYLAGVEVLPTWVDKHERNGKVEYNILPLDASRREQWQELFGITENTRNAAENSYARTMEIVGDGLKTAQDYLAQQKTARDQNYRVLAGYPAEADS